MPTLPEAPHALQSARLRPHVSPESAQHKIAPRAQKHISASQLKSFAACPLAWRLSRTHRPEHVSSSLVFGTAFHAAAERFYQTRLEGKTATLAELMEAYDAKWAERTNSGDGESPPPPVKYSVKAPDPDVLRQTAGRMLEAFLAHAVANVGEVIAVEEEFLVPMAPGLPSLKGRIDLIEIRADEAGEKQVHVVDFKTAAKRMGADEIDRDQADLYALAVRQTGLLDELRLPLALRFDIVTKTQSPTVTPITLLPDARNEQRVIVKAREIWKCMTAGVCYPSAGWACAGCGYKTLCGKWPDIPHDGEKEAQR